MLRGYSRKLRDGDIINVDVTVFLDGFHGDTSRTFVVGNVVMHSEFVPLKRNLPLLL